MAQKLIIGIPDGSLVQPEEEGQRGGLIELLDRSYLFIENLGTNAPPEVRYIPWLEAAVGRPQELPDQANNGIVDVFFCGDDWVREWELRGKQNIKLLGLGIGKVDLVVAEKEDNDKKPLVVVASEYTNIARRYSSERYDIPDEKIPIVKRTDGLSKLEELKEEMGEGVIILESYGKTEAKVLYGIADLVLEVSGTGSTLRNYGLSETKKVMSSECSLFYNSRIETDPWKMKKANRIRDMLEGRLYVEDREFLVLNAPNEKLDGVLDYLRQNQLFGDEETVSKGPRKTEITVVVPIRNPSLPLVDIIGDLKDLGASYLGMQPLRVLVK